MTAGDHTMNEPTLFSMQQRLDRRVVVVVVATLALVLFLGTYASAVMDFETLSPYTGSILRLDTLTFLCSSNRVASGGY